jgi:hypothetical protein
MKKYISIILLTVVALFFTLNAHSQHNDNVNIAGQLYYFPIGMEGSSYLFEEWQNATIKFESGKTASEIKVRFDMLNNNLLFYNDELRRVFIVDGETIERFTLNTTSPEMNFIKYTGSDVGYKLRQGNLVHIVHEGSFNFLVKYAAEVVKATELGNKDKIHPIKYYFLNTGNQTSEIRIRYSSVYKHFPSKKKEIRKLISEHKLGRVSVAKIGLLLTLMEKEGGFEEAFNKQDLKKK